MNTTTSDNLIKELKSQVCELMKKYSPLNTIKEFEAILNNVVIDVESKFGKGEFANALIKKRKTSDIYINIQRRIDELKKQYNIK